MIPHHEDFQLFNLASISIFVLLVIIGLFVLSFPREFRECLALVVMKFA